MASVDSNAFSELFLQSKSRAFGTVVGLALCYWVSLFVYRLFLSPLSKFPGPKLAAATYWYQFYYDVILGGQYMFEIEKLHAKYGPVVRINPDELHISDPDFYEVLFGNTMTRRDKWHFTVRAFNASRAAFGTLPHNLHRQRRALVNPYFSKRSVTQLEPQVKEIVDTMCSRFREFQRRKAPLNLHHVFAALSLDVITQYSFGQSYDCINAPDFDPTWLDSTDGLAEFTHIGSHFGWLFPLMSKLPDKLVLKMTPLMANVIGLQTDLRRKINVIKQNYEKNPESTSDATIFHALLTADQPAEEKQLANLTETGQTLVTAGQVTTADTMAVTVFYLLQNPEKMEKVKAELVKAMPNPQKLASCQQLEQLPYLSAVIEEGLRLSVPISHRLQRTAPDEELEVAGWKIPKGTAMSMSSYQMHGDKNIFPNPEEFIPERWVDPTERLRLEKYMVAFGKGTRMCLGMNLAYAEIYLGLAAVLRRFDMRLYNTTFENVKVGADFFTPQTKNGPRRVHVMVE